MALRSHPTQNTLWFYDFLTQHLLRKFVLQYHCKEMNNLFRHHMICGWVKLYKGKWHIMSTRKGTCFFLDHLSPATTSCSMLFLKLLMKAGSCPDSYLSLWLTSWTMLMKPAGINTDGNISTFMAYLGSACQKSVKKNTQIQLPAKCLFIYIHTQACKLDRLFFV